MNPQPVLFTNRPGRPSGSKRSRTGGHVTRMGKSEMQKICFWLDSHGNRQKEKKKRLGYQNGSQRNRVPSALRLFTTYLYNMTALYRDGKTIRPCYGSTSWCFTLSCSCRNNHQFTYQLNYSRGGQIPGDLVSFDDAQILSTITTLLSLTQTKCASVQMHRAQRVR